MIETILFALVGLMLCHLVIQSIQIKRLKKELEEADQSINLQQELIDEYRKQFNAIFHKLEDSK